jgi:hypothetical protein
MEGNSTRRKGRIKDEKESDLHLRQTNRASEWFSERLIVCEVESTATSAPNLVTSRASPMVDRFDLSRFGRFADELAVRFDALQGQTE